MYIVSSCFLGKNCRYNGQSKRRIDIIKWLEKNEINYIDVCPELLGGLGIPRPPSEISGDKVINKLGEDLTEEFNKGALKAWELALEKSKEIDEPIEGAILKAKSPSCGKGLVHDGSFEGGLVEGNGIFTRLLLEKNIAVYTEEDFEDVKL